MNKGVLSFLAMAFGFTWVVAAIGFALDIDTISGIRYVVLGAIAMLGPAFAAIVQQRFIDREPWSGLGLRVNETRWPILLLTVLVGVVLVPMCLGVIHLLGDVLDIASFGHAAVTTERFVVAVKEMAVASGHGEQVNGATEALMRLPAGVALAALLLSAVAAAFTVNLPFMLGEELGWRGYLWQALGKRPVHTRIGLTGLFWGLWHAPLIAMGHNYPGHRIAGIGLMVIFCLFLSVLFDWTRTRSGSIWSSCVLHGLINGSAGAMAMFSWGGHELVGSIVGVAGLVTIAVTCVIVLLLDGTYRKALFTLS
ncbi:MAG: CPBP family intramembrane metalloprotease [Flavobacteriales bacterium]|nr:CPBP family intramembrane metalloprotease [Flavobacteriales bacterium]